MSVSPGAGEWDGAFCGCIVGQNITLDAAQVVANCGEATIALSGHPLPTSEDLVKGYERHGMDLPGHLPGHFALVIHDPNRRPPWVFARDAAGSVPLYYARTDNAIHFGDTIGAILPHLGDVALNPEALVDFLTHCWTLGSKTFFKDVHIVPPGTGLSSEGTRKYFDFEHAGAPPGDTDMKSSFLELFERCVRDSLGPDPGCHVSGGLDSSAVSITASKMLEGPLPLFGTAFPEYPKFDESPYAEQVARSIGAEWHPVSVEANAFPEVLTQLMRTLEEPKCHPPAFARFRLEQTSSAAGCQTILTGRGADELFTGYDAHRQASLDRPRERRTMLSSSDRKSLLAFEPSYDVEASFGRVYDDCRGATALERILALDYHTLMANWMIVDYKVSRHFGARCSAPFLDPRMIRFALNIPASFKCPNDTPKALLKSWLADILPPEMLTRPKVGFRTPMGEMMTDSLESYVRDRLSPGTDVYWDWFAPQGVSALVEAHFSGQRNLGWQLWALLCVREWADCYLVRREWAS